MCDRITMPNGAEIESIDPDGSCLCGKTQNEILTWIVQHLPDIEFDTRIAIIRDHFGWIVKITKKSEQ